MTDGRAGTGEPPQSLNAAAEALQRAGRSAETVAWPLLSAVTDAPHSWAPVEELKSQCGTAGDSLERLLLWYAAREGLQRLNDVPVHPSVRSLLEKELRQVLAPKTQVEASSYEFRTAAKFATLRRFPSGPMDWEVSRIPRSWLLRPGLADRIRLTWFLFSRSVGFGPCFYMHVAPNPRKRALVLEAEVSKSYYRMARSLELQPDVRAIIAAAWFHDQAAVKDHPHLEVLNRPYVRHGGAIFIIGPAGADSGVLERNSQRRADYEAGRLQYRVGFAIWPRKAAIAWARQHPEFDGENPGRARQR